MTLFSVDRERRSISAITCRFILVKLYRRNTHPYRVCFRRSLLIELSEIRKKPAYVYRELALSLDVNDNRIIFSCFCPKDFM